jgi:hypothetical protein
MIRRWAAEPYGRFDDRHSNFAVVRTALEFMICRLLTMSENTDFHEFWCDGVEPVVHRAADDDYSFAGVCFLGDSPSGGQWLAPFELRIVYPSHREWPSAASVRIGHRNVENLIDRSLCCCRDHDFYRLSHWIYGSRPSTADAWAINVSFAPYPERPARIEPFKIRLLDGSDPG